MNSYYILYVILFFNTKKLTTLILEKNQPRQTPKRKYSGHFVILKKQVFNKQSNCSSNHAKTIHSSYCRDIFLTILSDKQQNNM